MPDIVSKIRVEAIGADQAAREIRKLKDAYVEVAAAAKGISPDMAGGDAFAKATNPPGAGVGSGDDIVQRESRSRTYRDQVRQRETGGIGAGGINRGIGVAEAVSTGRGGGAVGAAASGLGALVGGPVGLALLAGAAAAMGAQKFADNAFGRMENIYGTGMSQRLGRNFSDIEALQIEYGEKGIPLGMVQSFFGTASQSGLNMNKRGALPGTNWMMESMRDLGVDPGTAGGLMGALAKSDMDMNRINYGFFSQASGAFGRENTTQYLQEMARGIESMSSQGIKLTEETLTKQTNLLSGLGAYGGMTPEGAVALNQAIQTRGVTAAQLNRPEDIIAFQAMRREGESVTDTMMRMERDPTGTIMAQYEYLRAATGDDIDAMRILLSKSLGVSIGSADALMSTMAQMSGKDTADIRAELEALGIGWQGKTMKDGEWEFRDPAAQIYGIKQSQLLAGIEKSLLDQTTALSKAFQEAFGRIIDLDPTGTTWSSIYGGLTPEELAQRVKKGEISTFGQRAGVLDVSEVTGVEEPWNAQYKSIASGMLQKAGSAWSSSAGNISREDFYAVIGGLQAQVNAQSRDVSMTSDDMVLLLRTISEILENALQGVNTD